MSDVAVDAAVAAGREAEFVSYVAARQAALLRTAVLLTGDRHSAEDLLQTALAKLYLSWGSVRRTESMDAYVRRVMVNQLTSWWRRAWRRREISTWEVSDRPDPRHVVRDAFEDVVQRDAMWRALQTLPPGQRAALVLRYYEDLSEAQTAEVLGCSVGTVKSQVHRALNRLRASYEGEGDPQ